MIEGAGATDDGTPLGTAAQPNQHRVPIPRSRSAVARLLAEFRKFARKITGRDIDLRLLTDEERARFVAADPRPPIMRMGWRRLDTRRRFYEGAGEIRRRFAGRAAPNWELVRQMNAGRRQIIRESAERNREAVRVEKARRRPLRKFTPH